MIWGRPSQELSVGAGTTTGFNGTPLCIRRTLACFVIAEDVKTEANRARQTAEDDYLLDRTDLCRHRRCWRGARLAGAAHGSVPMSAQNFGSKTGAAPTPALSLEDARVAALAARWQGLTRHAI